MSKDDDKKAAGEPGAKESGTNVSLSEWKESSKLRYKKFPGPPGARALLRVACERTAYADMIAHAKENVKGEVCGFFAGEACEDDDGPFIVIKASLRGNAAKQGSAHVTITHDTWNAIHETMEKTYPKLTIVGWYHTHPGFGVEFSDMDEFCHKNFFPLPTQIALVTDPLSGDVAIAANAAGHFSYVERFWIDAREHQCRVPASQQAEPGGGGGGSGVSRRELQELETRLNQVLEAVNEQRKTFYTFLFSIGFLFCAGFVMFVTNSIWSNYKNRNEPPQVISTLPVPVRIEDKDVMLGVTVTKWNIPPELDAMLIEQKKQEVLLREAAAEKEKAEREKAEKEAKSGDKTGGPAKDDGRKDESKDKDAK